MRFINVGWGPSILCLIFALAGAVPDGHAARGGNGGGNGGGKPGGGDPPSDCDVTVAFPVLAYPTDGELFLASADGCRQVAVMEGRSFNSARLKYDSDTKTGYFAWTEVPAGQTLTKVWRQSFKVVNGELDTNAEEDTELLVELHSVAFRFDIKGEGITTRVVLRESRVGLPDWFSSVDLANCDPLPCTDDDMVSIYPTGEPDFQCLVDEGSGDCYVPSGYMAMTGDKNVVYFDVGGGAVSGIARAVYDSGASKWGAQELIFRGDLYSEPGVESLSSDDRLLAVSYLAGFQQGGLRDDRIIFLETDCDECDVSNPTLTGDVLQNRPSWHATWTVDDTLYFLGNEGKRRKLVHPIEEFDPVSGLRQPIGISLNAHYIIDSSL